MQFPGMHGRDKRGDAERLAIAMGWFSYGLGAAQLLRTGTVNRTMGIPDDDANHTLQQGIGIREIVSGTGILFRENKAPWVWMRVAGDVMDLAVLGVVSSSGFDKRKHLIGSMAFIGAVLVVDVVAARRLAA